MPKLTKTGYELGSSETPAVVLMKTPFQTNQDVLMKHRDKINKVMTSLPSCHAPAASVSGANRRGMRRQQTMKAGKRQKPARS